PAAPSSRRPPASSPPCRAARPRHPPPASTAAPRPLGLSERRSTLRAPSCPAPPIAPHQRRRALPGVDQPALHHLRSPDIHRHVHPEKSCRHFHLLRRFLQRIVSHLLLHVPQLLHAAVALLRPLRQHLPRLRHAHLPLEQH